MLDEALANDITIVASLSPGSSLRGKPEFGPCQSQGQPAAGKTVDICGLQPEIVKFCGNVGTSVGAAYGDFPAFSGALIHTEVRDAGAIPASIRTIWPPIARPRGPRCRRRPLARPGVDYNELAGFPASHVIADDDPLYVYYRWYWKTR